MSYDPYQPQGQQPQQPYGQPQQAYGGQQPYGQPQQPYGDYPSYTMPSSLQFGSWGARFAAYLLDCLILFIPICILLGGIGYLMSSAQPQSQEPPVAFVYLFYLLFFTIVGAYHLFFWITSGQTIGHKAVGLRVIRENGETLGLGPALLRLLGFIVNSIVFFLPIGWLWPLWDKKSQGWHDKIAGTIVVRTK